MQCRHDERPKSVRARHARWRFERRRLVKIIRTIRDSDTRFVVGKVLDGSACRYVLFCDGREMAPLPTEFADIVSDIAYSGNDADTIAADMVENLIRSNYFSS